MQEQQKGIDRPRLTITGGIARKSAQDELGNAFVEFEVDSMAEQEPVRLIPELEALLAEMGDGAPRLTQHQQPRPTTRNP